jgi:actin-like ATPase involved in cell morphogenesis
MPKCRFGHDLNEQDQFCTQCPRDQRRPLRWLQIPQSIDLPVPAGSQDACASALSLKSVGPWPVNVTISPDTAQWLEVSPKDLTIPGDSTAEITLTVDPGKCADGDTSALTVIWNGPNAGQWSSRATLNVTVRHFTTEIAVDDVVEVPPGDDSASINIRNDGDYDVVISSRLARPSQVIHLGAASVRIKQKASASLPVHVRYDALSEDDLTAEASLCLEAPGWSKSVTVRVSRPQSTRNLFVGIDFGTTNSSIAYAYQNADVQTLRIEGSFLVPSVVTFLPNEDQYRDGAFKVFDDQVVFVGIPAANMQELSEPRMKVIRSIKRHIDNDHAPSVTVTKDGAKQTLGPKDIAALIIEYLIKQLEAHAEETVRQAMITYPNGWSDNRIEATKLSAMRAGLQFPEKKERRPFICKEAEAAARSALPYLPQGKDGLLILVIDFGGGTLDVVLIRKENRGGADRYDTLDKGQGGDFHLGGDDIDDRIIQWLLDQHPTGTGLTIEALRTALPGSEESHLYLRLKKAAETAKISLSRSDTAHIALRETYNGNPVSFDAMLTKTAFNDLIRDLLDRAYKAIASTMQQAKVESKEVDAVVMVGGTSNIPAFQTMIKEWFGPDKVVAHVHAQTAIALGAAQLDFDLTLPGDPGKGTSFGTGRLRYPVGIRLQNGTFYELLRAGMEYGGQSNVYSFVAPPGGVANIAIFQYIGPDANTAHGTVVDGGRENGWDAIQTDVLKNIPAGGGMNIEISASVTSIGTVELQAWWKNPNNGQEGEKMDIKVGSRR